MEKNERPDLEYLDTKQTSTKLTSDESEEHVSKEMESDISKYSLNKPKRRIIKAKIVNDKN